jgi:hypothetical protein
MKDVRDFLHAALSDRVESPVGNLSVLEIGKLWPYLDPEKEHASILINEMDGPVIAPYQGDLMVITGQSKDMPPLFFATRLSQRYPDVTFKLDATTEGELTEFYEIKAGVGRLLHKYIEGHDEADKWRRTVFVRDGVELNPPQDEWPQDNLPAMSDQDLEDLKNLKLN